MAQTNASIITHAWLEGTNDFQQRISSPTQGDIARTVADLSLPGNADLWNFFANTLNNTIGQTLIEANRWQNPYERFRLENLRYGNFIREIMPKWLKSHTYSDTSRDLLDVNKPEYEQWFYTVNYAEKIPWDLNRAELLRAMQETPDSFGINALYDATSIAALNSDSYSIYSTCNSLFQWADSEWGEDGAPGLFRVKVDAGTTRRDTAQNFLEAVRAYLYKLTYPSKLYNHVDVPTFLNTGMNGSPVNEAVMFTDADMMAMTEVRAYAELFNVTDAEMRTRNMVLDTIPLSGGGVMGILTGDVFVHWHDVIYGIFSFFNIDTLNDKFVLQHQAIVAPNPAVPVVVFDQNGTTLVPVVEMQASKLTLTPAASAVELGGTVDLNPQLVGSVTANDDGVGVLPDSAVYEVTSNRGVVNTCTYVDRFGTLHVQKSGIPVGATLTITATAAYVNPSERETRLTATASVTVAKAGKPSGTYTVTYSVTDDSTYGAPGDVLVPGTVIAKAGTTVELAPPLETAETEADGKNGTWAFTGWSSASGGTPIITEVASIAADTVVYGSWKFTPNA